METGSALSWDDLRILLMLRREGSLLAAGKALEVSTSTVSRRVDAIEAALGRRLVQRGSAGVTLEPTAIALVELAEEFETSLSALRRDTQSEASGSVRVSLGEGFLRPVTAVLAEVRRLHPAIEFELVSEARPVDLSKRKADIGIRTLRTASPMLIERAIGSLSFSVYASSHYVERRLRAARLAPADFEKHDFIGYDGPLSGSPQSVWLRRQGAKRFVMRSNSDSVIQRAVELGQGIALLADAQARAASNLVRLLTEEEAPALTAYVVYHRDLKSVPRIRITVDALQAALRDALR
ncbi:MAG TPA: LysR family transcriptional regulator [Polyangiaceae bacterium]|jgi:DNA-binding transcriptional LysR family regulator|nr:LysR family transcriptional regulator [Polyangiaceae bacterium]